MELNLYKNNFETKEISLIKYLITISIFIIILIFIVFLNNNFNYYYSGNAFVKENNCINILVRIEDLEKITKNKKIIIEGTTFTYQVINISDESFENISDFYKSVFLKIDKLPSSINLKNNYVNYKIVTRKNTILNYIIDTVFGGKIWKN